jgi:DnaA family protein
VKQLAFDLAAAPAPTLDNFVTGRNAEVVQRLREVARGGRERFVYLWGAPASGRTHLLRGAVHELERGGARAAYIAAGGASSATLGEGLEAAAVDDVDRYDEGAQAALFNLYNRVRESGGALIAAGAAPPQALDLRADVSSRLAWGFVYEVRALSDAEKTQALAEHAAARGFSLPPDVARYLLNRVQRDMRTLIAMVESLDRYSLEAKRPVTVPLARDLLGSVPEFRASKSGADPDVEQSE